MSAETDIGKGLPEKGYEILSIEPADPPGDLEGGSWYHYLIGFGDSTISGYQQGTRKAVTRSVEEVVAQVNERRFGKRGRVHLDMTDKRKKPAGK